MERLLQDVACKTPIKEGEDDDEEPVEASKTGPLDR